ncbi:PTS system, N-acetylgalactosamine-specific IIA component [Granulicatella balaenopterae]|uniref:PTS system, N-acetylgalactosamine-specific IIA component n=1 Tax=Granulicatella balaenopterae TaxID=137733 RepID=A0A1H9LXR4_9LACT|nr:PTS galactosamine/N-acetylgalactosamine transporter subunit IIA [Granulicatella balaenopterae]SER16015.1 PTS system, N-acetylgalactosamine-specific IIA component [Granulicatella balaenopterae]
MIGLVLTGHGEFAPGLAQALKMIAGKQEAFKIVAFKEDEPLETLEGNMKTAIAELEQEVEEIIVCADLLGGSPFKAAMVATVGKENVKVVTGVNLAMLIEVAMTRLFVESVDQLVEKAITTGQTAIQTMSLNASKREEEVEDEDGI